MIKLPNTLSFRLAFLYAISSALILIITLIILYQALDASLKQRHDDDLNGDINELQTLFDDQGLEALLLHIKQEETFEDPESFFIKLFNEDEEVIHASNLEYWPEMQIETQVKQQLRNQSRVLVSQHVKDRDAAVRVAYARLGAHYYVQFAEISDEKEDIMDTVFMIFLVLILIVTPSTIIVGSLITQRSLKSLQIISQTTVEIQKGNFDKKVDLHHQHDEIQNLVDTFNAMTARINVLINEMREMIDNIAHDLRSPIGRIRAIAEDALSSKASIDQFQAASADTIEECDRLLNLINTTLEIAEADAKVGLKGTETVDLSQVITDAFELFEPAAEQKNIQLSASIEKNCVINGITSNIQRMVANLVDNALKYSNQNGHAEIKLAKRSDYYEIVISDDGIGIPENEQERIFDKFYRCDQSRTEQGSGLGLSFSRAVARFHGGEISISSELNQGTSFTVILPISPI